MNKSVKWTLVGLALVGGIVALAKMTGGDGDSGTKVAVEKIDTRSITETVSASGKIYPEVEVKVSPDISGEITALTVQEGDSVRKGQVLARIFADIYSSQRDQAAAQVAQSQASVANSAAGLAALKAQLDQDRNSYNRNKQLFDEKVISKAELEQFETKLQASQAQYNAAVQGIRAQQAGVQGSRTQLAQANKNLGRATIVAPMDGIVSQLNVKLGERVVGTAQMAGTEMLRVANMNTLEVRVDVGENDVVKVHTGDSADVQVDAYNNRKFRGVVTQIASSTNKTGGMQASTNDVTNYEVHIRIDPSSYADLMDPARPKAFPFRPGMNANASIKTRRRDNVLSIPITSVAARVKGSDKNLEENKKDKDKEKDNEGLDDAGTAGAGADGVEEVAFVVKTDGTVEKRVVTTGIQDMNYIEVLTGLKPGEQVVSAPFNAISKSLKNGDRVKVVKKDELFENKKK
ncbi:efflux RND transporter periplasmic adaptor subunit [Flaviaesturariibacter amylovorans]|uniref:Efflux RND transporter periplasmic adaptor subunit n=1 Tax=Flaviaesturariibacter amylovorans TaxID=1084520 RepID=A0ABP8GDB2_9BACT